MLTIYIYIFTFLFYLRVFFTPQIVSYIYQSNVYKSWK